MAAPVAALLALVLLAQPAYLHAQGQQAWVAHVLIAAPSRSCGE